MLAFTEMAEQGFRTCLGVLALVKTYGPARVDAACQRGVTIRARTVTSIRSILKTGLDRAFLEGTEDASPSSTPTFVVAAITTEKGPQC